MPDQKSKQEKLQQAVETVRELVTDGDESMWPEGTLALGKKIVESMDAILEEFGAAPFTQEGKADGEKQKRDKGAVEQEKTRAEILFGGE